MAIRSVAYVETLVLPTVRFLEIGTNKMELNANQKKAANRAANALRMPLNTVANVVSTYYDELKRNRADITCPDCGRTFKTKGGLSSHKRAKHEK